jgi:hypothetical protein
MLTPILDQLKLKKKLREKWISFSWISFPVPFVSFYSCTLLTDTLSAPSAQRFAHHISWRICLLATNPLRLFEINTSPFFTNSSFLVLKISRLGMVVHTCNPSHGTRREEDWGLRPVQAKLVRDSTWNTK